MLYRTIETFPKRQRYTIGSKCDIAILDILELLYAAATRERKSKLLMLGKVDVKLQLLKTLIRLAKDTNAMSRGQYIRIEERLLDIGSQLGGWIQYLVENR